MTRLPLPRLGADPRAPFPPVACALQEPNGLLAMGGDLGTARLLNAYSHGIFPWFSEGQPILWWSPDPRMVFDTASFRLPSRFARQLRHSDWFLRADTAFAAVVTACATVPRPGQDGTWITPDMVAAYVSLHQLGHAHSVEVFDQHERLVGGIYGVAIGQMFFGESMFSAEPGGSKVALAGLLRLLRDWQWPMLDAQVENAHLLSLGARRLPRDEFMGRVTTLGGLPGRPGSWIAEVGQWPASGLSRPAA